MERGRTADALEDFERILVLAPERPDGWSGRGFARHLMRDDSRAIGDFDEAVRRGDRTSELQYLRGVILKQQKKTREALEAFEAALAIEPGHERAIGQRGVARHALGDLQGARRDYDASLTKLPRQPELLVRRSELRAADGDRDGAIADVEAALRVAPKDWPARKDVERLLDDLKNIKYFL